MQVAAFRHVATFRKVVTIMKHILTHKHRLSPPGRGRGGFRNLHYIYSCTSKIYALLHQYFSGITVTIFFVITCFSSCSKKHPLFTLLDPSSSGIAFNNELTSTDSLNIMNYIYLYNGGGVATGDINNDGLTDVYFTSNKGDNKLYLNKGNMHFEDITASAGVKGMGDWKTGVTMADVNGDGWLDIYVCAVGGYLGMKSRNQLYVNNHHLGFFEQAAEYGLNEEGFNTQAAFFDYDKDGDLDMYLVKHAVHSSEQYIDTLYRHKPDAASGDKLFRNNLSAGVIKFTDITEAAGIFSGKTGFGLSATVNDFNGDGWPDLYVSNDFNEEDYYYLNNKNGTFTESNKKAFGHESHFSMGSDAADINNDGWTDLVTLDMLPDDEKILKTSMPDDPLEIYRYKRGFGYQEQCSRNCLQLNGGGGKHFSDIGLYAGIAATDWSWSPLLADFNNDGICDLFITSGIYRRPNNLDFMNYYAHSPEAYDAQKKKLSDSAYSLMPEGRQTNSFFKGTASLKFINTGMDEGLEKKGFSNGAAYADLDNDGDLDLITNNLNGVADIYRNNSREMMQSNYISIHLEGASWNRFGYGASIVASAAGRRMARYVTATKGFESCSAGDIIIGTGAVAAIDTLLITWPDSSGTTQTLYHVKTNQHIILKQGQASQKNTHPSPLQTVFTDISRQTGVHFVHRENPFNDFAVQPLMPHGVSTEGPKLAVGDINGDGLDDLYVCGATGQAGALYIQHHSGTFTASNEKLFASDSLCEDVNAVFFDADNDKDLDLFVVSGGNQWEGNTPLLYDRLYLNDGRGSFRKSAGLPLYFGNKSVAIPADIDHDGDMDLFVGGRVIAGSYGETPLSYILVNDGSGKFSIQTGKICPGLDKAGMVTDAAWTDINHDGWMDLVVVGEWMPVSVFINRKGHLQNMTREMGLDRLTGLWNCIKMADINGDGYEDMLLGNWGENSKLHASQRYPLIMYEGDLDGNGFKEQILCTEKNGSYYPFFGKDEMQKILPALIRKKYADYKSFAGQTAEEVFGDQLEHCKKLSASTLSTAVLVYKNNAYTNMQLPSEMQWTPVFSWATGFFTQKSGCDIIACGNFNNVQPYEGIYDAGYGTMISQNNDGDFTVVPMLGSGIHIKGEVRDIKKMRMAGGYTVLVIAVNNGNIIFMRPVQGIGKSD